MKQKNTNNVGTLEQRGNSTHCDYHITDLKKLRLPAKKPTG